MRVKAVPDYIGTKMYGSHATASDRYRMLSMPHAQCYVSVESNTLGHRIQLVSYRTVVIEIVLTYSGVWECFCTGVYSATTSRHINRFTKEFFGDNLYHFFKRNIGNVCQLSLADYDHVWDAMSRYATQATYYHGHY